MCGAHLFSKDEKPKVFQNLRNRVVEGVLGRGLVPPAKDHLKQDERREEEGEILS